MKIKAPDKITAYFSFYHIEEEGVSQWIASSKEWNMTTAANTRDDLFDRVSVVFHDLLEEYYLSPPQEVMIIAIDEQANAPLYEAA